MRRFNPREPRRSNGRWTFAQITSGDLSSGDARRSPEVSVKEFQSHAMRGAAKYELRNGVVAKPRALEGTHWQAIKKVAYNKSREPWGGTTIDTHNGHEVKDGADLYALTVKRPGMDSVHVAPDASPAEFDKAMEDAKTRFGSILARKGHHIGVFHDADLGRIDIDPVLVTDKLSDVHDIGAYTHAVGGAYHFKSGDGFWPPHVKEQKPVNLSIQTPFLDGDFKLSTKSSGKIAYWKQILPKSKINYTAKDGSRQQIDFDDQFLADLANNQAVDSVAFLLADPKDNSHTNDPERQRGSVSKFEVRGDGLYAKIIFPDADAARAVINNPKLGVSARICENIQRSDGSTLNRGIKHILGTLDPQVSGMSDWQSADLSTEQGEVLDLSNEEYEMAKAKSTEKKTLEQYSTEDIDKMTPEELDAFLTEFVPEFDSYNESTDEDEDHEEPESDEAEDRELVGADMSKKANADIELANQTAASANARATEALNRLAAAQWENLRNEYLAAGVPPHALDLAAPVLSRPDEVVIDLSSVDAEADDLQVSKIITDLLDTLKGTIDLSEAEGHNGTFVSGDGEDPDQELLNAWAKQS